MNSQSPRFRKSPRLEEDQNLVRQIRAIFVDNDTLTEQAKIMCQDLKINPQDLQNRNVQWFRQDSKEPKDVIELRYNHYQNKRKEYLKRLAQAIHQQKHNNAQNRLQTFSYMNSSMHNSTQYSSGGRQSHRKFSSLPKISSSRNMLNPKKSQNSIQKLQTSETKQHQAQHSSIQNNAMTPNPLTSLLSHQNTPAVDKQQQPFLLTQPLEQSLYSSQYAYQHPQTNTLKQMFNSQQNYHPASLQTSKHKVNQLTFSNKLSPSSKNNRDANSARHMMASQRSMIAASIAQNSPQIQDARSVVVKNQQRIERLNKVREKAMANTKAQLEKHIQKQLKDSQNEKKVREYQEIKKMEFDEKVTKDKLKREQKKQFVENKDKLIDKAGYAEYGKYLTEVEQSVQKKKKQELKDAQQSHKKLQTHMKEVEQRHEQSYLQEIQEQREGQKNLKLLNDDIQIKTQKYQKRINETVGKACDHNSYQRQIQLNQYEYDDQVQQKLGAKVLNKVEKTKKFEKNKFDDMDFIKTKIQEHQDAKNQVREAQLQQEQQRMSQKVKATLERRQNKEEIKEKILHQKSIDKMKAAEINKLRKMDQLKNKERERERKLQYQFQLAEKREQTNQLISQIIQKRQQFLQDQKFKNNMQESSVLSQLSPKQYFAQQSRDEIIKEMKLKEKKRNQK